MTTFKELACPSRCSLRCARSATIASPEQRSAAAGRARVIGRPDRHRQDRGVRPADGRVHRSGSRRGAALVLTPTRSCASRSPSAAGLRRDARRDVWRVRARRSATRSAAARRRPHRRRHRRRVLTSSRERRSCCTTAAYVVLDEATDARPRLPEDVEKILAATPSERQTALFSATMPPPIRALATATSMTRS